MAKLKSQAFYIWLLVSGVLLTPFGYVGAASHCSSNNPSSLPNPLIACTFQELLGSFIRLLLIFATPILVLMLALAAFLFITGGQDPNKVSTAKNIIKYAIIGYGIILMGQVLVSIIQGIFT